MPRHGAQVLILAGIKVGGDARLLALADDGPGLATLEGDVVLDGRRVGHDDLEPAGLSRRHRAREARRAALVGRHRQDTALGRDWLVVGRSADAGELAAVLAGLTGDRG